MSWIGQVKIFIHELQNKIPLLLAENNLLNYYAQGSALSLVIFLFYLELNPAIGGIFLRPDSLGKTKFRLQGIIPVLKYPFQSWDFWKPCNWDLNFIMFTGIGSMIYTILKYYQNQTKS